jgi:hypothetical protein
MKLPSFQNVFTFALVITVDAEEHLQDSAGVFKTTSSLYSNVGINWT